MNRQQAKELLPIIQAFAEGKDIQFKICGEWEDLETPVFLCNAKYYRIKPSSVKPNQSNNQNSIFQNKI